MSLSEEQNNILDEHFYEMQTGGGCTALVCDLFIKPFNLQLVVTDRSGTDYPNADGVLLGLYYVGDKGGSWMDEGIHDTGKFTEYDAKTQANAVNLAFIKIKQLVKFKV